MSATTPCGGCENLGSHRRHCPRHPDYHPWRVLAEMAHDIGDRIGSNDPGLANSAYALSARIAQAVESVPEPVRTGEAVRAGDPVIKVGQCWWDMRAGYRQFVTITHVDEIGERVGGTRRGYPVRPIAFSVLREHFTLIDSAGEAVTGAVH